MIFLYFGSMKHLICSLIALLLLPLAVFSQEEEQEFFPVNFEVNQTVYLLGDSIHVRQEPKSNAKSLTQLPIGTRLTILERSEETLSLNGFTMPWYKVQYGKNKKGYIWGGKFSMNSFRSNKDTDVIFHFGLEKVVGETAHYQIRVEKDHKEVQRISFEGFGGALKKHECTNLGSKGLSEIDDVIYVSGYGEYCGDGGGTVVLFWTKNKLYNVYRLSSFSDVPVFAYDTFIFPSDMDGKKDRILLKEEVGEHQFYEEGEDTRNKPDIIYEKNETTILRWDGNQLVPGK